MSANGSPAVRPREDLAGRTFGHLTVVEFWWRSPQGDRCWLCRCDCLAGENIVRSTSQLTHGTDGSLTCRTCRAMRRSDDYVATDARREAGRRLGFRNQWATTGGLWSPFQSLRLGAAVRAALAHAVGPLRETYDGPTTVADVSDSGSPLVDPRAPRCYSLEEVGTALGVTRERARQLEAHALRKFAKALYRINPELFGGKPPNLSRITGAGYVSNRDSIARANYAKKRAAKVAATVAARMAHNAAVEAAATKDAA